MPQNTAMEPVDDTYNSNINVLDIYAQSAVCIDICSSDKCVCYVTRSYSLVRLVNVELFSTIWQSSWQLADNSDFKRILMIPHVAANINQQKFMPVKTSNE